MDYPIAAPGWVQLVVAIATAAVVAAASGLVGVWIGAALTKRREEAARRHGFVKRQVEDFYSPMVGVRREIRAKSELQEEISGYAGAAWQELCEGKSPEALVRLQEERWSQFEEIIEYNNRQLREELLPSYRQMLQIFRDNYWLAEESTRAQFSSLLELVEIWNRWLARTIPPEVVDRMGQSEETLKPLYQDLEDRLRELRTKLAVGKA